jgi:hypothetical protein
MPRTVVYNSACHLATQQEPALLNGRDVYQNNHTGVNAAWQLQQQNTWNSFPSRTNCDALKSEGMTVALGDTTGPVAFCAASATTTRTTTFGLIAANVADPVAVVATSSMTSSSSTERCLGVAVTTTSYHATPPAACLITTTLPSLLHNRDDVVDRSPTLPATVSTTTIDDSEVFSASSPLSTAAMLSVSSAWASDFVAELTPVLANASLAVSSAPPLYFTLPCSSEHATGGGGTPLKKLGDLSSPQPVIQSSLALVAQEDVEVQRGQSPAHSAKLHCGSDSLTTTIRRGHFPLLAAHPLTDEGATKHCSMRHSTTTSTITSTSMSTSTSSFTTTTIAALLPPRHSIHQQQQCTSIQIACDVAGSGDALDNLRGCPEGDDENEEDDSDHSSMLLQSCCLTCETTSSSLPSMMSPVSSPLALSLAPPLFSCGGSSW